MQFWVHCPKYVTKNEVHGTGQWWLNKWASKWPVNYLLAIGNQNFTNWHTSQSDYSTLSQFNCHSKNMYLKCVLIFSSYLCLSLPWGFLQSYYWQIQGVPKWLERFQSAITALKTRAEVSFPHGTKQQVFKFPAHAQTHSPLLSWSVT